MPVLVTVDLPRRPLEQRREVAPGAGAGERLERLAAREHQGDHRTGQRLPERERARHGEQRDDVDAGLAAPQVGNDGEHQRREHHGGGETPEELREAAGAGEPGQSAGQEAGERHRREQAPR